MPRSGSPNVGGTTQSPPTSGAKNLQERLHILLTRLAKTTDVIKTWPESDGDDASIHVETTTKLINCVLDIVTALQKVEGVIKADAILRKSLQECKVPINLLDLLDHGNGLNPDCFSRGLLLEALGQLAGLKRRKLALEMLGAAIQAGLNKRDAKNRGESAAASTTAVSKKRKLDIETEVRQNLNSEELTAKKTRRETMV